MPVLTLHYPSAYGRFRCVGAQCPMTCCAGWRIAIDKASAKKYRRGGGAFGRRLRSAVDWRERRFKSENGRCPMLSEDLLCDIYKQMGEENMCRTCRNYPRHREDYGALHEIVLLPSCPEVARRIVMAPEPLKIVSAQRNRSSVDVAGVDHQFLHNILSVRAHMFHILYARKLPLNRRLAAVLALGRDVQRCGGNDERAVRLAKHYEQWIFTSNFDHRLRSVGENASAGFDRNVLFSLETVVPQWPGMLTEYVRLWQSGKLGAMVAKDGGSMDDYRYENLMAYYLYMYLPGAVYDGDIYTKVRLALFSVLVVRQMYQAAQIRMAAKEQPEDRNEYETKEPEEYEMFLQCVCVYSRQIDHSDSNLEILEDALCHNPGFSLAELFYEISVAFGGF